MKTFVLFMALGLVSCQDSARALEPVLVVSSARTDRLQFGSSHEAIAVALAGIEPLAVRQLPEGLRELTNAAIRRAHPLIVELDDDGQAAAAAAVLQLLTPLTAAANLNARRWRLGELTVELHAQCPERATCFPLFGPSRVDGADRRARMAAWALSSAAIIRAHGPAQVLAASLRARSRQRDSMIALVFDAGKGQHDLETVEAIRRSTSRARSHAPSDEHLELLSALEQVPPEWELPLALEPNTLLVVPRLGALARLDDFEQEMSAAGAFDWVVRSTRLSP